MTQNLFLRPPALQFTKVGADISLPKDAVQWEHEVLQELYKAAPSTSEYDARVVMQRVDPDKGYGFGFIELQPRTALTSTQLQTPVGMSSGVGQIRVPVVIAQYKMKPLDIFLDKNSKAWPLNVRRIRSSLFRPQVFDTVATPPKPQSTISMLQPPTRDGYSMINGGMDASGIMGKMSSVLAAVMPQALDSDVADFERRLTGDDKLAENYKSNTSTHAALRKIAEIQRSSRAIKVAASVVQFVKQGNAYMMRTAGTDGWMPVEEQVSRQYIAKHAGDDVLKEVDQDGSSTIPLASTVGDADIHKEDVAQAKDTGVYKVEDKRGRHLVGMLFVGLLGLDGVLLPLSLFTNGSSTAVQGEIAGVHIGPAVNPPVAHLPAGYGCFLISGKNGSITATVPLHIKAGSKDGFLAVSFDGTQVKIVKDDDLVQPALLDGVCYMPHDATWLPLGTSEAVALASKADEWRDDPPTNDSIEVEGSKHAGFRLSGAPVEKVAMVERQALSAQETEFYLAALGVGPATAKVAMRRAMQGPTRVKVARSIRMPTPVTREKVATYSAAGALRRDLLKEAAVLPDPLSVDAVLSLGFVTPENLLAYVGALPTFDEVVNHMCELLLAVRMGQKDVPEGALERAIRATEEVVDGLRTIAFAQA